MLLTMVKIEIIGPKKYFYQALALLHQLGTLHIENLSRQEDFLLRQMDVDEEASESRKNLRDLLTRLKGIISVIEPSEIKIPLEKSKDYSHYWEKGITDLTEEAQKLLGQLEDKTRELANKKSQMELELSSLSRYRQVLQKIYPLAKRIVPLKGSETIAFLLEGEYRDSVTIINQEMDKITKGNHELISTPIAENTTAAIIVFNKKYSAKVHQFLSDKVNELNLPTGMKNLSIDNVISEIEHRQKTYPDEIKKVQLELNVLTSKWYSQLQAVSNAIHNKVEEIEQIPSFGQTNYTFIVHGWLPYKHLDTLKDSVKKNLGEKVLIRQLELAPEDLEDAPVVMENPRWAKPFEIFQKIFQPPRYGTIDPTIFVAIFFPIFFGFIVGDMGYGLIVFITATFLRYKFKDIESEMVDATTRIFQIAGIATFIFGVFYGEAFGNLLEKVLHQYHLTEVFKWHLGPLVIPYNRNPEIVGRLNELMLASLALGFIHLSTSYSMGIVNSVREKNYKHMWEKIGALIFMLSIIGIAIGAKMKMGIVSFPSMILLFIGVVLSVYGGGGLAIMENTFGIIGNLASYLRLMALGLAGAILAGVANNFATTLGSVEIGIIAGIFMHVINIVVHTISPAIHSFRLNFLEGFGKFYEEGGREYKPFKARG